MIPVTNNLQELQDFARDVYAKLNTLLAGNIDLQSRRITGAAPAIGQFDYITKYDLDSVISGIEAEITASSKSTALTLTGGVRFGVLASQGAAAAHTGELFIATDTFQEQMK